jgi:Holliday junction resolvase RusA-like endonuclease
MKLELFIPGIPVGAGSKRAFPIYRGSKAKGTREFTGRTIVTDTTGQKGKDWRSSIHYAAFEAMKQNNLPLFNEPVILRVHFWMPRPKSHYRHNLRYPEPLLRDDAPSVHSIAPDATKLVRALEDGFNGVVWRDDSLVVEQHIYKDYTDIGRSGASVSVTSHRSEKLIRDQMPHYSPTAEAGV